MDELFPQLPVIIGHRGACGYAPENTLASLRKAKELGIEWVEFDVKLTADDALILFHDEKLSRTSTGRGKVAHMSYADIIGLDVGSHFSSDYIGETAPTLVHALDFIVQANMRANIEIKPCPGRVLPTVMCTLDLIKTHWPSNKPLPLLSSFSAVVTDYLSEQAREYPRGFLLKRWQRGWQRRYEGSRSSALHIHHRALNSKRVATAKQTAQYVLAFTVNDPERAKELFDWGVDGVFSDYPDRIIAAS